jgi:hypothetical protein
MSTTQSVFPDLSFKHSELSNLNTHLPERFKEMRWVL